MVIEQGEMALSSKKVEVRYKENVFYSDGDEALAQVTQGCGWCSVPWDFHSEAGSGPGQPDLAVASLLTAGELDQMAFRGPFQC